MRQMLDHIFFAVIYAVPNLAYHSETGEGFGIDTKKCERVMEHKLLMQKKVYNEKQNLIKAFTSVLGATAKNATCALTFDEFKDCLTRFNILNT